MVRIDEDDAFWADLAASSVAVLALPFYMGYLHSPLRHLLLYALVAAIGLVIAEQLTHPTYRSHGVYGIMLGLGLRCGAVLIFGGVAFLLALWLV